MKIAINKCFGGFGLSPKAIELYLKKQGKKCFFYKQTKYAFDGGKEEYTKISIDNLDNDLFFSVYTRDMGDIFNKHNDKYFWYESFYDKKRTDKLLIETIEELGEDESSGSCAKIEIIE
ncbi:unnamed protein product, partial [marine sediment metagenome]